MWKSLQTKPLELNSESKNIESITLNQVVKHENMCLSPSSTQHFSFVHEISQTSQPAQLSQPTQPPQLLRPSVPSVLMDTSSSTQDSQAMTQEDGQTQARKPQILIPR